MARTFIQEGEALDLIAPSGGVADGTPVLVGALLVVPQADAVEGASYVGLTEGVFSVPKANSQAWTVLAKVYWDDTNKCFTTTAASNYRAGVAVEAVANTAGLTTGKVRLDGVSVVAEAAG